LQLALEDYEIFLRWRAAFDSRRTTLETHPALDLERERHDEIKPILDAACAIDPRKASRALAEFKTIGPRRKPGSSLAPLQVRWSERSPLVDSGA
jgi:hypothetical protein